MSNHHKFAGSSSLEHCNYFDDTGTMEIKFTSGAVYHYPECPKGHYIALKEAESAGKYFWSNVRARKFVKVK